MKKVLVLTVLVILVLTSCTPRLGTRGYFPPTHACLRH